MGEFKFKKFSVVNEKSAMKVNTDGVLLGALMTLRPEDRRLLDIGTGTGTVALMAAQRLADVPGLCIHAIDIDEPSASEAALNFARSPWAGSLTARHISLEDYAARHEDARLKGNPAPCDGVFDLVFSNPPYFDGELRSPESRRREARHSESMSYRDILEFSSARLDRWGRCSLILPAETETELCRYARMCGLFPFRIVRIRTVPSRQPRRIVAEFSRERPACIDESCLTIQEEGRYTREYTDLTSPFYIGL